MRLNELRMEEKNGLSYYDTILCAILDLIILSLLFQLFNCNSSHGCMKNIAVLLLLLSIDNYNCVIIDGPFKKFNSIIKRTKK